jgi:hypothetical protein
MRKMTSVTLFGRSSAGIAAMAIAVIGSSAFSLAPGHPGAPAAGTVKWIRISSNTKQAGDSAGLYRTADGRLHVAWSAQNGASSFSLHYSTLGAHANVVSTGTILSGWAAMGFYPRLVAAPGGGMRVIFPGANGTSGSPYNNSDMYSATAGAGGGTWKLAPGSMSQSKLVPLTDDAAAAQQNGTPVAAWSTGAAGKLAFHVGLDANAPATAPDHSVSAGPGGVVVGPTLVRDKSGHIWAAWYDNSFKSTQGYYVDQIVPVKGRAKAPGSGGGPQNNQPLEAVAFAVRAGGGLYLAYCVPNRTVPCAHIALWRVGSGKAHAVPGSATGHASHVAIAAEPGGHLSVGWYDSGQNKVKYVTTNSAATGFGKTHTISAPPSTALFDDLQLEGSKGALDLIALTFQLNANLTAFWATEVKP